MVSTPPSPCLKHPTFHSLSKPLRFWGRLPWLGDVLPSSQTFRGGDRTPWHCCTEAGEPLAGHGVLRAPRAHHPSRGERIPASGETTPGLCKERTAEGEKGKRSPHVPVLCRGLRLRAGTQQPGHRDRVSMGSLMCAERAWNAHGKPSRVPEPCFPLPRAFLCLSPFPPMSQALTCSRVRLHKPRASAELLQTAQARVRKSTIKLELGLVSFSIYSCFLPIHLLLLLQCLLQAGDSISPIKPQISLGASYSDALACKSSRKAKICIDRSSLVCIYPRALHPGLLKGDSVSLLFMSFVKKSCFFERKYQYFRSLASPPSSPSPSRHVGSH